jgi:hypothetical protein
LNPAQSTKIAWGPEFLTAEIAEKDRKGPQRTLREKLFTAEGAKNTAKCAKKTAPVAE